MWNSVALLSTLGRTMKHLNPAELAIHLFGGVRPLARAVDRDPAAVCRWRKHGVIPTSSQKRVLDAAKALKIKLSASEIVLGR